MSTRNNDSSPYDQAMSFDPLDIAQRLREEDDRKSQARITRLREVEDVVELLDLPAGRRFIWRYLSLAGVYRSSFHQDTGVMAKLEGRRELGLALLADVMDADPDAYTKMRKENTSG